MNSFEGGNYELTKRKANMVKANMCDISLLILDETNRGKKNSAIFKCDGSIKEKSDCSESRKVIWEIPNGTSACLLPSKGAKYSTTCWVDVVREPPELLQSKNGAGKSGGRRRKSVRDTVIFVRAWTRPLWRRIPRYSECIKSSHQ